MTEVATSKPPSLRDGHRPEEGHRHQRTLLLVGLDPEAAQAIESQVDAIEAVVTPSVEAAVRAVRTRSIDALGVLTIGDRVAPSDALELITELDHQITPVTEVLVLAAGDEPERFHDLIAEDRITYLSPTAPSAADSAALVVRASRRARSRSHPATQPAMSTGQLVTELVRRLAFLRDANEIAELIAQAAGRMVGATRSYCLLYHPGDETLRGPMPTVSGSDGPDRIDSDDRNSDTGDSVPDAGDDPSSERCESAAVGLVSFVLRSGVPVRVETVGVDQRYDRDADDPLGSGSERFAAVPIEVVEADESRTIAVLAVARDASTPPFSVQDVERLENLAIQVSPHLAASYFAQEQSLLQADEVADAQQALFRRTAVDSQLQGLDDQRDPLRVSPGWTRWSYWLLLAIFVVGLAFSFLFKVHDYAAGPALIQLDGRTEITARTPGTIRDILVSPGDRVREGQVLLGFHNHQEAADLRRIETEFRLQLARRLRDPSDPSAEQALIALRTARDLATERLAERRLQAPVDGVVGEIRARRGQYLSPGQPVMTLIENSSLGPAGESATTAANPSTLGPRVVIALPGEYRPQIGSGMEVRLSLDGYSFAYQWVIIESVGDEVVGAGEARRILGPDSDSVVLPPSVVLVTGRLSGNQFVAEGRRYLYHDGMQARAEVRLRSERLIFALLPALRALGANDSPADQDRPDPPTSRSANDQPDPLAEAR